MNKKIKRALFLMISIIIGIFLSFVIFYTLSKGTGMGQDCFLQRGDGSCITIFSFLSNITQIIIFFVLTILMSVGVYRELREKF